MKTFFSAAVVCMMAVFTGCAASDDATSEADTETAAVQAITASEQAVTTQLQAGHVLLGSTPISGLDHDVVQIGSEEGVYSSIRLRVVRGTLIMTKVKVTFGNGDDFQPPVRLEFNDRTPTRDIDLPGNGRFIRRIAFTALETHGNPVIEVWGDKAAPRPQWTKLAKSHVDGGVDHDKVHVGTEQGAFSAVQIRVKDSDLVMENVKLTFGNGNTFEPNVRFVFDENTRSRVIDLPGDRRYIDSVAYNYGNIPGGGAADLELWGMK